MIKKVKLDRKEAVKLIKKITKMVRKPSVNFEKKYKKPTLKDETYMV